MISSIKNNCGFTLLEMLLVLCIVSTVTFIVLNFTTNYSEAKLIDQFFKQVQLDLQRVQALSIEKGRTIIFTFNDEESYYAYYENGGERILERVYPTGIRINELSTLKKFKFNFSGEIRSFGTIKFFTPEGEKMIIVNMQKGRMRFIE